MARREPRSPCRFEFPARGGLPPVKLTWNEGARNGKRNLPTVTRHDVSREIATPSFARPQLINDIIN